MHWNQWGMIAIQSVWLMEIASGNLFKRTTVEKLILAKNKNKSFPNVLETLFQHTEV